MEWSLEVKLLPSTGLVVSMKSSILVKLNLHEMPPLSKCPRRVNVSDRLNPHSLNVCMCTLSQGDQKNVSAFIIALGMILSGIIYL